MCGMTDEKKMIVEEFLRQCLELCSEPRCPCAVCGKLVGFNGTSRRSVSKLVLDEVVFIPELPERRLRCSGCGARFLRRAPEVLPRVHFQACVHASVIVDLAQGASTAQAAQAHRCGRRTVRRLVERAAALGDAHEIARELLDAVDEPVVPAARVVERAAPLATHTARNLAAALALLVVVEALGSARGEEPPAFGPFMRARMTSSCPAMPSEKPRCRDPPSSDGRRQHPA